MTFKHLFLERVELDATTTTSGRTYRTPAGDLPSVTTVLAKRLRSPELDEWRLRVGEAEAKQISQAAMSHGNLIHHVCENFLLNEANAAVRLMPSDLDIFLRLKPTLEKNINWIYGVEFPLYSASLQTAGRTDALVTWQYHNAVLDFKTSRKRLEKGDSRIIKYNLQATAYAMMAEEMYHMLFPYNVVIVIPVDDDIQVLFKKNRKYRGFVKELCNINTDVGDSPT
jgi:hypothetical protein